MPPAAGTAITAAGLGHWRYPVWRRPARRLSRKRPRAPPNSARLVGSGTAEVAGTAVPCWAVIFIMLGEKKPIVITLSGALPSGFAKKSENPAVAPAFVTSISPGDWMAPAPPKRI